MKQDQVIHGRQGVGFCVHHVALYLGRSYPMALHVDDIIDTPRDLVVSITVPQGTVSTEVQAGVASVVHVQELLVIPVDGSGHPGPWLTHAQVTRYVGAHLLLPLDTKQTYTPPHRVNSDLSAA